MVKLIQGITTLSPAEIEGWEDEHRMRRVTEAGCAALMESIEELGVMKDPIQVRRVRHQNNRYVLMAGGHRLAVAKMLCWAEVPVTVWECTDDWAALMEIDDNVASRDLNALDTAFALAERKRIYEQMHPESKKGVAGGLARQGLATDIMSFAKITAEKFDLAERHVRRLVRAGEALSRADVLALSRSPRQVTLADLQELAKVNTDGERAHVIAALSQGDVKNAAAARASFAGVSSAPEKADKSRDDLKALRGAWKAASKPVRRDFVETHAAQLRQLLSEVSE